MWYPPSVDVCLHDRGLGAIPPTPDPKESASMWVYGILSMLVVGNL